MPQLTPPVVAPGALGSSTQPTLEVAEGLTLRPWSPADTSAIVAAYRDPEIQRWHVRTMTAGEAALWIESRARRWAEETGCSWAVTRGEMVLGQLGLRRLRLADGVAEVSYWLAPEARGRGVAGQALLRLTRWAFDEASLHRLELHHSVANAASCRVAEKAGYELEGLKRSEGLHADGWHDMHLHARIDDASGVSGSRRPRTEAAAAR